MTAITGGVPCYLPGCSKPARWMVTDTAGENGRDSCDVHMPRLVHRLGRKLKAGQLVVAPRFDVDRVADLAPLLMIGASVYGMVVDTAAAQAAAAATDETRAVVLRALTGREPVAAGGGHVRLVDYDGPDA